ncbi:MAG: NYN domain-containing protein [Actinomycetales bacterium]
MSTSSDRLAVLIDAENASPRLAEAIFTEIARLGEASARRVYGDFTSSGMRGWTEVLARWALQPQQNFANTPGKNSGDIALVIDAMDLLHADRFDGFCLVSSDSDFTRLAARIREQGLPVFGFGEQKTPESFRQACTRFIYVENLGRGDTPAQPPTGGRRPATEATPLLAAVIDGMDDTSDGWVSIGGIGSRVRNAYPDFDQRSYGFAKLSDLIRSSRRFDVSADGTQARLASTGAGSPASSSAASTRTGEVSAEPAKTSKSAKAPKKVAARTATKVSAKKAGPASSSRRSAKKTADETP